MSRKLILVAVGVALIGASAWGYARLRNGTAAPQVVTAAITRGDIVEAVGATGTLEAVTTVQVGTQVSGTVQHLYADFNSIVRKGQVLARLDPSLIQTQIEQQRANLVRAEAELERLRVALADARVKLGRARDLGGRGLIPTTEVEAAEVAVQSTEAQLRSSQAGVTQARANLNQQQVNLNHTVITAPIDGIVISRNVDEGQTVAASMNAPVLYLLAADLAKMKVSANIDEADVGKIRPGQRVTFRVDAYPTDQFDGTVVQVRLNPVTVQNVVTYQTVIEVPNPDLRLKPGMTANVNIEIARRENVLRLPAGALRFRPTADIFAALGQQPPADFTGGRNGGPRNGTPNGAPAGQAPRGTGPAPAAPAGAAGPSTPPAAGSSPAETGNGDRAARLRERLAAMSPEDREALQARLAQRRANGGRGNPGGSEAATPSGAVGSGAQTIDALFAPLAPTVTPGRVWIAVQEGARTELRAVRVRAGVGDGQWTELVEAVGGELREGQEVVTGVLLGTTRAQVPGTSGSNPLMGPQRGRGPGR